MKYDAIKRHGLSNNLLSNAQLVFAGPLSSEHWIIEPKCRGDCLWYWQHLEDWDTKDSWYYWGNSSYRGKHSNDWSSPSGWCLLKVSHSSPWNGLNEFFSTVFLSLHCSCFINHLPSILHSEMFIFANVCIIFKLISNSSENYLIFVRIQQGLDSIQASNVCAKQVSGSDHLQQGKFNPSALLTVDGIYYAKYPIIIELFGRSPMNKHSTGLTT